MISLLRKIKHKGIGFFRWFYPPNMSSTYLAYRVYHHKNDSLMSRIKMGSNKIYEPEETTILLRFLKDLGNTVMLDIGSNIGLMSLNVLSAFPETTIYAFEPGFNQYNFLKKNIYRNGLESSIIPFNFALGSSIGIVDFFIHKVKDSSGDGFLDTGRGGISTKTTVKTITLDYWWIKNGRPKINVVKIDTEGSELSILSNSVEMLNNCRPFVLIEICNLNYEKYGLTFDEHVLFFHSVGYNLLNSKTNESVQLQSDVWKNEQYYIAIPN
jgi:FkbM family methyltransferase